MAIKYNFAFSNKCYTKLVNLISDVLLKNHKMAKDMYQSKMLLLGLDMHYEKLMSVTITACFSRKRP